MSLRRCKFQWAKFRGCSAGGGIASRVRGEGGVGAGLAEAQKPPLDLDLLPRAPERETPLKKLARLFHLRACPLAPLPLAGITTASQIKPRKTGFYTRR